MSRAPNWPITKPAEAKEEILRILAERYLSSLTPGTAAAQELNRLMVAANLWRPAPPG
jgi:hypothetical protein